MHSHSNAPALALRAIGMHPKYAGYGYSLAILRITHRHPEYIYRLPKMVYPRIMELFVSVMTDFILHGSFEDPSSDEKLQAEAL